MPASHEPGPSGAEERSEEARTGRPVLDGAAFGVYEDEDRGRRFGRIVAAVLAVSVLAVGVLVWRAVNTDAELELPSQAVTSTTTTAPSMEGTPPTEAELRALIPDGLDTCSRLVDPPDTSRVSLLCPRSGTPEAVAFVLFATIDDRDEEFDRLVAAFDIPISGTDCALGEPGVHDYVGFDRIGQVACASDGDVVDFVWTSDEAPLLVRARGAGSFADHYAFWDRVVERTDAGFPLPAERVLLDELPATSSEDCRRDLELNVEAGGSAAVVCEPSDAEAETVSSVQFDDPEGMAAWIETRRESLTDNVFGESDDACTPDGFGREPTPEAPTTTADQSAGTPAATTTTETTAAPPPVDAGFTPYELSGTTGEVLCFVDGGTNVVAWTRDDARIASIARSDREAGASMRDLLAWWAAGGHRP